MGRHIAKAKRPDPANTRKRPEAWHAQCLREDAEMLLDKILQFQAWTADESYPHGTWDIARD